MNLWLLAAWLSCQSLDTVTSWQALSHPTQYHEINPLTRSKSRLIGIKVTVNLGTFIFHEKVKRNAIIPTALAIHGCAGGIWNVTRKDK